MTTGKNSNRTKNQKRGRKTAVSKRQKRSEIPLKFALVPLDTPRIRKTYISKCKQARTTFYKARRELDYYEQQEKPAFERWVHANLGPEITAYREITRQLQSKKELYERIQREAILTGCNVYECYRRIMQGESELDRIREEKEQRQNSDSDADDFEGGKSHGRETYEDFYEFFSKIFNDFFAEFDREGGESWEDEPELENAEAEARKSKIKEIYREMCRRLHPDAGGENTKEQLELWYEVQEAYRTEDLERLETLCAKTEILTDGTFTNTPVSHIQHLTEEFREARSSLRDLIRRARKESAWGFLSRSESDLEEELERQRDSLIQETNDLNAAMEEIDSILEELRDPIEAEQKRIRQRKTANKKTRREYTHPDQMEFGF